MEAIPNHIKEQFAPYLEDTNRYLPACLRVRYAQLRDTAVAVDRIRDRLAVIRAGVAAARAAEGGRVEGSCRSDAMRPDKNAGAS